MSLAEASEARKARLLALKKRKLGEEVDEESYVCIDKPDFTETDHHLAEAAKMDQL